VIQDGFFCHFLESGSTSAQSSFDDLSTRISHAETEMKKLRANLSMLFCLVIALYFAFAIIRLAPDGEVDQNYLWDFQMYYYTAQAYLQGVNPYDRPAVEAVTGHTLLEFFYFPLSLQIFIPLARLSYNAAALVFLCVKCCLLVYLMFIWHVVFLEKRADPWFFLFCLVAFNSTIYLDFLAGNVSIIEQASLWTSFYFFIRRRFIVFSFFVGLVATFKFTPLFFGLLILLCRKDERYKAAIAFGSIVCITVVVAWLIDRDLFAQFFSHALGVLDVPLEGFDPGLLPLIKSFLIFLTRRDWIIYPTLLKWSLYLLCISAIVVWTWKPLQELDITDQLDARFAINIMCLLFALLSPRFKDYSYIVLLVPAYFIMEKAVVVRPYPLIFLLCGLSAYHITLPGLERLASVLWAYYPLLLAIVVWATYLIELNAPRNFNAPGRDVIASMEPT
jgi:hypothetical protein